MSRISTEYDFVGNPVTVVETHGNETATTSMTYDTQGRLTSLVVSMGGCASVNYIYDELGRPSRKGLGRRVMQTLAETDALVPLPLGADTVIDSYTIQGWLRSRQSSAFSMNLKYEERNVEGTAVNPAGLAGNITSWETFRNGSRADGSTNVYSYDLMPRLLSSSRYEGTSQTPVDTLTEKDITYDSLSRITGMTRYGNSASDVQMLSFDHDSEQRDMYGNVTFDADSGSTLEWNMLNLPRKITRSDGTVMKYTYLADGTKVQAGDCTVDHVYLGTMTFIRLRSRLTFESMGFVEGKRLDYAHVSEKQEIMTGTRNKK